MKLLTVKEFVHKTLVNICEESQALELGMPKEVSFEMRLNHNGEIAHEIGGHSAIVKVTVVGNRVVVRDSSQ